MSLFSELEAKSTSDNHNVRKYEAYSQICYIVSKRAWDELSKLEKAEVKRDIRKRSKRRH